MNPEFIQSLIHKLEVGVGSRIIGWLAVLVPILGMGVMYDLKQFHGFSSPEAMDSAQVARNLAEGRGFTTDFIRPFSIYLVQDHNKAANPTDATGTNFVDNARVNGPHPDLANAPVYPLVLAGLMKTWKPANWKVDLRKPFWSSDGVFQRYKPEFHIAIFNQVLLYLVATLTFLIARKLCDIQAAWLATVLTLGSQFLWQFSISGLSTMLLLVILMGLVWCLIKVDELGRAEQPKMAWLVVTAAVIGLLTGLGMLTRYSFGWLIVPVIVFLAWSGGARRAGLISTAGVVFLLVITPWLARNYSVSGTLLGTAGYACIETTPPMPEDTLMRSLAPLLTGPRWVLPSCHKVLGNLHLILQGELLTTLGWGGVLFFSGLLLGWRNVTAQRLRYFALIALGVFSVAEALGRTNLSAITPAINSENLLVLLIPLANIFGVGFFLTMIDRAPTVLMRRVGIAILVIVACRAQAWTTFTKASPRSYPPYYPPELQTVAGWMQPDELMMSDIPWAVAWYGHKPCVWLTLNANSEFFALNDYIKPVNGLYLSTVTLDSKFLDDCVRSDLYSWPQFVMRISTRNSLLSDSFPKGFPLKTVSPNGLTQGAGLFLTDHPRWIGAQ